MIVSVMVAHDERRAIGKEGKLPWRLPDDLKRFKALTLGKPVIMGRRTFESIGRPLPGRMNIVLTHRAEHTVEGVTMAHGIEEALSIAESSGAEEAMVIGGGEIYGLALSRAHKVYASEVHTSVEGDVWFPPLDPKGWRLIHEEMVPADERNEHAVTHRIFVRSPAA